MAVKIRPLVNLTFKIEHTRIAHTDSAPLNICTERYPRPAGLALSIMVDMGTPADAIELTTKTIPKADAMSFFSTMDAVMGAD